MATVASPDRSRRHCAARSLSLCLAWLMRHGVDTDRKHVLATAIEHKAVLEPLGRLREFGFEVELVPVTTGGYVEPDAVRERLRPDTLVVSVMHANNETGVLQPVTGDRRAPRGNENSLPR